MEMFSYVRKKTLKLISLISLCACFLMFLNGYFQEIKFSSVYGYMKEAYEANLENNVYQIKSENKSGKGVQRLNNLKWTNSNKSYSSTGFVQRNEQFERINSIKSLSTKGFVQRNDKIKRIYLNNAPSSGFVDFENLKPINFSKDYKNPCWIGKDNVELTNDLKFHCIPYFYIIGVMKCGTTDLYQRLLRHTDLLSPGFKEAQWFAHNRLGGKNKRPIPKSQLQYFIGLWDKTAKIIQSSSTVLPNGTVYNPYVIADGSPSNIYLNINWQLAPGNEGLQEPRITNLHCIKRLYPAVKVILMFRNPVDRLYSDYYFRFRHGGSPSRDEFHHQVVHAISDYKECIKTYTMRKCIYDNSVWEKKSKFRLELGFFEFYMKETLGVFDKSNILTLLLSHYQNNIKSELRRVMTFLGFSKPSDAVWEEMTSLGVQNDKGYIRKISGKMRLDTRDILQKFYAPFNKKMAELMNDERYLFLT